MIPIKKSRGDKRLELNMRDVLDGLEDLSTYINFQSMPETIEILSIEPADRPVPATNQLIHLDQHVSIENNLERSSNIIQYPIQPQLTRTA